MSDLKEQLCTKDKDCLERLYRKVKGYAALKNIQLGACESTKKEARVDWIASALERKEILITLLSDLRAGESACLRYIYESGGFGEYIRMEPYWKETGLIDTVTDHEGFEHGVMSDLLMDFLRNDDVNLLPQISTFSQQCGVRDD